MKLSETGVRRPVATLMAFVAVFILGCIAWQRLAVDMMPEIESPSISVFTRWDGASTEDVEQQITRVIESALGSVTDLDEITSTTSEGVSRVTCKFKWGTELGEAANDMRDLLERAKRRLPDDADDPVMFKFNTANMPILGFSVTATENIEKLEDTVNDDIVDVLKRVPGVGTAEAFGGLQRQINVFLDPAKLSAHGLSVAAIAAAIDADNQTEPAGNVKIGTVDYTIRVPGEFATPEEVGLVVVKRDGDRVVRVSDVARVEDGFAEETRVVERMGRAGMMVDVQKRSGENTMAVARRVMDKLEEIKRNLPADYSIDLVFDTSDMIGKSIRSVGHTVAWGGLFVVLVTLFFLRSARTSLVIALTIPFSLIIASVFMFLKGWTINLMSLSALALAVGMVVDNAVVVLENVISHVSRGAGRREAAMFGADEVGTAILASTLTTIVVFVPLVFVDGVTGIMLGQLGGIVTATLVASVVCSLLLTPMLASKLLRPPPAGNGAYARFYAWSEARFAAVERGYGRLLSAALHARWLVVLAAALVVFLTVRGFGTLGSEFMGKEDTGQLSINYQLPLSTRYEITAATGRRILEVVHRVCGDDKIVSEMLRAGGSGGFGGGGGSHAGMIRLRLVDAKFRDKTADEYGDAITREVSQWPEIVKVFSNSGNFLNRILMGGGANLLIEIYGYDLEQTTAIAERIKAIAQETPGSRDVRVSQDMGKPELSIAIDRAKASAMGLTMQEITETVSALFQGADASQYREGEDEYDITLRLAEPDRASIEDIRRTELPLPGGGRVRLDAIAQVVEGTGPVSITHKNQQRIVNVEFDAAEGRPEGDVMADVRRRIESEIMLPNGVSVEYGGMIEEQEKSEKALSMMIMLGIVLVYMVMAAQFESLVHPLLIMFAVPFAFSGVVVVLSLTGTPLSMSAYIGMVLLVGVVVNNAIVLVDYVNLLRARGRALRDAIVEGGRQRLRPVMITTCTTVLGMMPMATSHGDGSATWRPLGLVVVGGLAVASLVSMVLVPTLYYIVERRRAAHAENQVSIQHSNP